MNTTAAPLITAEGTTVGPLDTFPFTTIEARNLRAGMLVLDELGTAVAHVDHRLAARRNSGEVRFLVEDLEQGGWVEASWHANATVVVAAR